MTDDNTYFDEDRYNKAIGIKNHLEPKSQFDKIVEAKCEVVFDHIQSMANLGKEEAEKGEGSYEDQMNQMRDQFKMISTAFEGIGVDMPDIEELKTMTDSQIEQRFDMAEAKQDEYLKGIVGETKAQDDDGDVVQVDAIDLQLLEDDEVSSEAKKPAEIPEKGESEAAEKELMSEFYESPEFMEAFKKFKLRKSQMI